MEFTDVVDGRWEGEEAEITQVRSLRQRIIAAQIRDSEIETEVVSMADLDNFDASVENVSRTKFWIVLELFRQSSHHSWTKYCTESNCQRVGLDGDG